MANEKDNPTATRDAGGHKEGTEDKAREAGRDTQAATRRAAEAAREISEDTGRTGRGATEQTADMGRRTARAGSEMSERAGETLRDTAQTATGTAQRMSEQAADQFGRMFGLSARTSEEVAQQTSQNLDVMLQCSSILADGFQNIWREWMNYTQEAMQKNVNGLNNMMRSRSVHDFMAAQSDLMRDEMETLLQSSVKISEMSARVANDAATRINHMRGSEEGQGQRQHQQHQQPQRRRA
ncbi:MAG TPA: phasin family protein [Azospirillaceae bacterium]|nr:phasin family protein [Azospirillaceae bacterium]